MSISGSFVSFVFAYWWHPSLFIYPLPNRFFECLSIFRRMLDLSSCVWSIWGFYLLIWSLVYPLTYMTNYAHAFVCQCIPMHLMDPFTRPFARRSIFCHFRFSLLTCLFVHQSIHFYNCRPNSLWIHSVVSDIVDVRRPNNAVSMQSVTWRKLLSKIVSSKRIALNRQKY